jgi:hypothetical protein
MKLRYKQRFFNWLAQLLQKVSGVPPLTLSRAVAGGLKEVTAYGGCALNGIPSEYTELDSLTGDGNAYIDTGLVPDDSFGYKINISSPDVTTDRPLFGCRELNNTNTRCWYGYTNGTAYFGWGSYYLTGGYSYNVDTFYEVSCNFENDRCGKIDGTIRKSSLEELPTITKSFLLFAAHISETVQYLNQTTIKSAVFTRGTETIMDLVPVKRNSDNELGMYDRVSLRFFTNQGTGTFIAGNAVTPSPDKPCEIWCNNGIIKADYTRLEYLESTGTQYIVTNITGGATIKAEAQGISASSLTELVFSFTEAGWAGSWLGQANNPYGKWSLGDLNSTTTVSYTTKATIDATFDLLDGKPHALATINSQTVERTRSSSADLERLSLFAASNGSFPAKVRIWYTEIIQNNGLVCRLLPAKRNSDNVLGMYDTVSGNFFTNAGSGDFIAGPELNKLIHCDGLTETLRIVGSNSTATTEMLLKLGDYVDSQDILNGIVNRQLGIQTLTGNETWTWLASSQWKARVSLPTISWSQETAAPILSNQFIACAWNDYAQTQPYFSLMEATTNRRMAFAVNWNSNITSLEDWQQWLQDQYNNGTPVIVVYPLATPTTESVTLQPMSVVDGDNTLEITQASLPGLELAAEYKRH